MEHVYLRTLVRVCKVPVNENIKNETYTPYCATEGESY